MPKIEEIGLNITLEMAEAFCKEINGFVFCIGRQKFFIAKEGVYNQMDNREVQKIVMKRKDYCKKMPLRQLKETIDRIATIKMVKFEDFNPPGIINFENGLFYLDKKELKTHTPDVLSTIRIPYHYIATAECPLWIRSLEEIMEGDKNKIRILQEFFGYCLTTDTHYEKALIMIGDGANGKSVILSVLGNMVGHENCSSLSLKYFNNSQMTSILANKLVNICGEVPKRVEDFEADFKTIVTGERLTVSPKYIPEYVIKPYCKLIFAVNELPRIDDHSDSFFRRIILLELNRKFSEEEQNKNLKEDLKMELPGIFNWALLGLERLKVRGTFMIDEYMKEAISSIKEMNNPTAQWCKEFIIPKKDTRLIKGDAYEYYVQWCMRSGYKQTGLAKFSADVYKYFKDATKKNSQEASGDRRRFWPDLAFRNNEHSGQQVEWQE